MLSKRITLKNIMIPYFNRFTVLIRNIERQLKHYMGLPPRELAIAYLHPNDQPTQSTFSLQDVIGDGFLYAVPKSRRTIEKRLKRKWGSPEYVYKMIVPKTNIKVCSTCGSNHERGVLCAKCYQRVEAETKEIKEKMLAELGPLKPIEEDVIVLYNGESVPDEPKEFWKGKRIIEMKKERPQWFSKNLLQRTTQQPSDATDVKPKDLA